MAPNLYLTSWGSAQIPYTAPAHQQGSPEALQDSLLNRARNGTSFVNSQGHVAGMWLRAAGVGAGQYAQASLCWGVFVLFWGHTKQCPGLTQVL